MTIEFLKLTLEDRKEIFNEIFRQKNLSPIAIEKDWWVVQTLKVIFGMEMAASLVFKGGTSLSKGWGSGPDLYKEIVRHRSMLTRINGMDYTLHAPKYINPMPPEQIFKFWEDDYKIMQEQMIYGDSLPFKDLMEKINALKTKINKLDWEIELKR